MLKRLFLKNYALFRESEVHFPEGLNIITGETGAGKSLLVGALGLIIGKRSDSSAIFYPGEKCIVEAEFHELSDTIVGRLANLDAFDIEDRVVILRRVISPKGRSRAFVNDTPVSLQILRAVATQLVDLHGQNENQILLSPDRQIQLLDAYAGCERFANEFRKLLAESNKVLTEIRKLEAQEVEAKRQLDYYQYQLEEFEAADLQLQEEEELEKEYQVLQNSEEIQEVLGGAFEQLYGSDRSIYNQMSLLLNQLGRIADFSDSIEEQVSNLHEANEFITEAANSFQRLTDEIETDPKRLEFVEERIALYHTFKRKYSVQTTEELLELQESFSQKVAEFSSIEDRILELKKAYEQKQKKLAELGLKIEQKRLRVKPRLEKQINSILKEVGFSKARFMVEVKRVPAKSGGIRVVNQQIKPNARGLNEITFLIQTNPGLPAGSLSQIASGGEVSRVMLAIKAALAEKSEFPVLIFDEIDTGISGEVANKVGKVMKKLAERFQILSITHLPQIAAKGHQHFMIYKQIRGEHTFSSVKQLTKGERVKQVAMMLSGEKPTESAIKNATELIG